MVFDGESLSVYQWPVLLSVFGDGICGFAAAMVHGSDECDCHYRSSDALLPVGRDYGAQAREKRDGGLPCMAVYILFALRSCIYIKLHLGCRAESVCHRMLFHKEEYQYMQTLLIVLNQLI